MGSPFVSRGHGAEERLGSRERAGDSPSTRGQQRGQGRTQSPSPSQQKPKGKRRRFARKEESQFRLVAGVGGGGGARQAKGARDRVPEDPVRRASLPAPLPLSLSLLAFEAKRRGEKEGELSSGFRPAARWREARVSRPPFLTCGAALLKTCGALMTAGVDIFLSVSLGLSSSRGPRCVAIFCLLKILAAAASPNGFAPVFHTQNRTMN